MVITIDKECREHKFGYFEFFDMLLRFKVNFDSDFKIDLSQPMQPKYSVAYNLTTQMYEPIITFDMYRPCDIYFSSEKVARQCADWLNKM